MMLKKLSVYTIIVPVLISFMVSIATAGELSVVMSTSMLASAAREITPQSESITIVTLLPPSSCPGHFDLSPRVIPLLKSATIAVRHDYQNIIEEKLAAMGAGSTTFLTVDTKESPLIPSNYYLLAKQIGTVYNSVFPEHHDEITIAVDSVKHRTDFLSKQALTSAAPWKGRSVIASEHVSELCRWLGFNVAGIIKRPEDMTPQDFQNLVILKADIIVANLQEGVQGAESLGKRMKLPVAVLSNFPDADGFGTDYYSLMKTNLFRLDEAWRKR